ncbi:uncharacterized protein N7529_007395 [Penicillium soppii]|uniref:uncharacterized protein n=1 Tax=Penicillium soppii TaxID=69789 RepID=UPI0025489E92|nr:uncharacterized protein N7529_007395 [Penicillium soppii]KAJ5860085.1 hypothetical protein N7529_007395 [Penicillium soppii]
MELALPNDVLLLIGEQLERKTDRWNLVFASSNFHNLFLPLVYREVHIHNWRDANSFLHAILQRPGLARAVRKLDLTKWQVQSMSDNEYHETENSALLIKWVTAASHSRIESQRWIECLAKGLSDAWIALILPLLTQLRKLHLTYSTISPYLERIMQRAVDCEAPFAAQPAFRYLNKVSLHHQDFDNRDDWDSPRVQSRAPSKLLLPFFQLPSVRAITANSVMDPSSIPTGAERLAEDDRLRVGFSSITEIDLRASSGNHGMEMLIASCANLKSFKYQHSDSHIFSHGYQPSAFHRSLRHSKKSLQTLWLDNYGSHYPFTAAGLNQSQDEWFGSLVEFIALREVRVRLTNLLDIRYQNEPSTPLIECLPSSLETLYIEGCEERYLGMLVSQLQTVIKNRLGRFPRLKCVDIEGKFQNVPLDDDGHLITSGPVLDTAIKDKVFQAAEPLHIDCVHAGIDLHLHDRALEQACSSRGF